MLAPNPETAGWAAGLAVAAVVAASIESGQATAALESAWDTLSELDQEVGNGLEGFAELG